jgi:hypothetical protein
VGIYDQIPEAIDFVLNTEKEIKYTKSSKRKQPNTYELLGLDRDVIYKRFGIESKN